MNRRKFILNSAISALSIDPISNTLGNKKSMSNDIEVLNPRDRVPVSMIIDDSTALVNMAHYGIPQFAEVFPDDYKQNWRSLPREIPDSFVAEFIEWCDLKGVKGKYSMVPYPACTGWLHRFIPGWSKDDLKNSLGLVRNDVSRNWDIHPEMISHTRVIDINTGLPYAKATPEFMENWEWSQQKSSDELGAYIAYALNALKEAGLYCEGVTTPGGFCHRNIPNLAAATMEAMKDVYKTDVSHFFRSIITEKGKSVAPVVMQESGIESENASCSVHIIGCTGDWFGGWDGLKSGNVDKFITKDLNSGRMVEVIESGDPALMVCHWPGIYYNGDKIGFNIFKEVVNRLEQKYGNTIQWMKLSEIARYWAAKKFISFTNTKDAIKIKTPFEAKDFTISTSLKLHNPTLQYGNNQIKLSKSPSLNSLDQNTYFTNKGKTIMCFNLPKGKSELKNG